MFDVAEFRPVAASPLTARAQARSKLTAMFSFSSSTSDSGSVEPPRCATI
jgi:hypothetical protein